MVSVLVSVCVCVCVCETKHAAEEVSEVIVSTGAAERTNILDIDSGLWSEFCPCGVLATIFTSSSWLKLKIYRQNTR